MLEEEEGWLLATLMAMAMSLATAMPLATAIPMALVALGGCQWLPEGAAWWLAWCLRCHRLSLLFLLSQVFHHTQSKPCHIAL